MIESFGYQLIGKPSLGSAVTLHKYSSVDGSKPRLVKSYRIEVSRKGLVTCTCEAFKHRERCKHSAVVARMVQAVKP